MSLDTISVPPSRGRARPPTRRMENATVREFGGGWNVIDNDLNLSSRFAKTLDNVVLQKDGSVGVRYGTRFFGKAIGITNPTYVLEDPIETQDTLNHFRIDLGVVHGMMPGHRVTISGSSAVNGIPDSEINGTHSIFDINSETSFDIITATNATSTGSGGGTVTIVTDSQNVTGDIVNMWYFQDYIWIVSSTGQISRMDSEGNVVRVWDEFFADLLSGSPAGWSSMTFASMAVFNQDMIVCNGIDKPLIINQDAFDNEEANSIVNYLQDLGTGSNGNTPIGRYVVGVNQFLCIAGDPTDPAIVHISNIDTSGTWEDDDPPSNGRTINLGSVAPSNTQVIRGLARFRDELIVMFDDVTVPVTLNIFDGSGNHIPEFGGTFEQHGCVAHRTMVNLGNDLLSCDFVGVPSIRQALFSGALRPERVSELIDPAIQEDLLKLSIGTTEDHVFSVYNLIDGQYMLFIPNNDDIDEATETKCYVYTRLDELKIAAWARFRGWNWRCGTRSQLGRVFLASEDTVYVMGTASDPIYGDFVNDPMIGDPDNGVPVDFDWEFPWTDIDERAEIKKSAFLAMDTKGTAEFTVEMYVDNILIDEGGNANPQLGPVTFIGGDAPGYGAGGYGDGPFGGGRNTRNEHLFRWPAKFKLAKLRFRGSVTENLQFVSFTFHYLRGSIRR